MDLNIDRKIKIGRTYKNYKMMILFADGTLMWLWDIKQNTETGQPNYVGREAMIVSKPGAKFITAQNISPGSLIPLTGTVYNQLSRLSFCQQRTNGTFITNGQMGELVKMNADLNFQNSMLQGQFPTIQKKVREAMIEPEEAQISTVKQFGKIIDTLKDKSNMPPMPGRMMMDMPPRRQTDEEEEE